MIKALIYKPSFTCWRLFPILGLSRSLECSEQWKAMQVIPCDLQTPDLSASAPGLLLPIDAM